MTIEVLTPIHESQSAMLELAARPASLVGATVGFISNGKQGTIGFFDHLERLLHERFAIAKVVRCTKSNFSAPAEPAIIEAAAGWQLAITGLGD